ncbi:ABC transporter ATP-binding protein [Micromonospora robiginosa]|uniref:ABC transporter ATP-binding protein n=1 Tax=Micromonospora robiginosa TaxID=2749844 RepID=A0A7L6BEZ7_9ACTN|nr:ABC transporter ATP-binding protein [Micromonospora ferruginea]QLQ40516.2 ABC transporter ATP-binding protein [Micromonospora ferruginea]
MRARLYDENLTRQKIKAGTVRRILPYAKRRRGSLAVVLLATTVSAVIAAAGPLVLKRIIDDGITGQHLRVVVELSLLLVGLALVDVAAIFVQTLFSARVGQGLVYELRTAAFRHVQRQPLAFFTRVQTGSLVSRLNTDIIGAQQALTSVLAQSLSIVLTVALVLAAMFALSWQVTLAALVTVPIFFLPAKLLGRRVQRLIREGMQQDAAMSSMMNERFNVSGAMLAQLYGDPDREAGGFAARAARVRDIFVRQDVYGRLFFMSTTLLTACTTALVYGMGGALVIDGVLQIGTLVALLALLMRLYGPINQLTSMQRNVIAAVVSFDRVFELMDLQPLLRERPNARALPAPAEGDPAPEIVFDAVSFRYPAATEVSIPSLETHTRTAAEAQEQPWILRDVSFEVPAGKLTALVGPSGAGKSTITHLVPRLYDPVDGVVRVAGHDVRDLTLGSLRSTVGVVSQDAHLFHDTIRANLAYADPEASTEDIVRACTAARIWDMILALPDGLDTVVGDRGYRLSGGEKQRLALARVLLKSPPIVVLDEATAHLDAESEAAIQQALATALAGRTSLVIAHRLATVRDADQIVVLDEGRVRERGTHESLRAAGGLYADLYRTQFAPQSGSPLQVGPTS